MKILQKILYYIHLGAYGFVLGSFVAMFVSLYIKLAITTPPTWAINMLVFSLVLIVNVIFTKTYKWIVE